MRRGWIAVVAIGCGTGGQPAKPPPAAPPPQQQPASFAAPGEPLEPVPAPPAVPPSRDPAVGLAGLADMTCAIRASGAVTCWGGPFGAPHAVPLGGDVVALALQYGETCALHRDGHVDCFALVGDKLDEARLGLVRVTGIAFATALASANDSSCVLEKSGDVACWSGDHAAARTSLHGASGLVMTTLEGPDWQFPGVALACAIVAGDLACIDVYRQAEQSRTDPRTPIDRYLAPAGTRPKLWLGALHVAIARADHPSVPDNGSQAIVCARTADGRRCVAYELDLSTSAADPAAVAPPCAQTATTVTCELELRDPKQPVALDHPVEVSWQHDHACARYGAGQVACWGAAGAGALGRTWPAPATPMSAWGLADATDIVSWSDGVVALRANGQLAYWGAGEDGDRQDAVRSAVPVTLSSIRDATKLVAGHFHACVLRRTGAVACWSIEPMMTLPIATQFGDIAGVRDARDLYATDFGFVARTADGTLLHLGDPQLDASAAATPAPIRGAEHAAAIAIAGHWVCVLDKAPGPVRCWSEVRKGATTAPIAVADDAVELAGTGKMFTGQAMAAELVVRQRDGHALAIALDLDGGKPVAKPTPLAAGARSLFTSETFTCARGAGGTACVAADNRDPTPIPRTYDDALALTAAPPACAVTPKHQVVCFAATDGWTEGLGRGGSRVAVPVPLD